MYVKKATAGPGDTYVTFDRYPRGRLAEMFETPDGEHETPTVVIVSVGEIFKVELRTAASEDERRQIGFALPEDQSGEAPDQPT